MKFDKLCFEIGIGIGNTWRYTDSTVGLYFKIEAQIVILSFFYIEHLSFIGDFRLFFLIFNIASYRHPKLNWFLYFFTIRSHPRLKKWQPLFKVMNNYLDCAFFTRWNCKIKPLTMSLRIRIWSEIKMVLIVDLHILFVTLRTDSKFPLSNLLSKVKSS